MTWQFTLTGLLIGGLVGLTGMGGGSLLTPILVILFGFKPTYAVGTDILHGAIFKSFGAVRHRRDRWIAFAIGAVFGFVVGLTSVGSGTFFGLVMVLVYPLTVAKIVGTDIFHAAALLWVAGVGHLVAGNVDLHAMFWLLRGSIPGVLLASQLTLKVPDRALRLALATVLVLSGVKLVNTPGADWIVLAGFIVGGIVFAGWGVHELRSRRLDEQRGLATDLTLS